MRIALFGTSADPPTVGHQEILIGLAQQFDQVWVWASDNPFKQHGADLEVRSTMLNLIVAEANDRLRDRSGDTPTNPISLYPHLSDRYSIVTVERAQAQATAQHLNATFTLVIGSDLVAQLPRWYRSQELLGQVQLLIVPRPGFPLHDRDLQALKALGTQVQIAQWQGLAVSSTAFREAGDPEPLTDLVYHFIRQHHLYPLLLELGSGS
ncbi:MAG: nicotinate-nucleotide adenylyltransferase [Prochlorotrichaceae cyanobacterium]